MSVVAAVLLASSDAHIDDAPLPLLPWSGDDTLIEWQVDALKRAGIDVIEVVLGSDADRLIPLVAIDDVEPIVHEAWHADPDAAVRIGATATPRDTLAVLILDVAQPRPAPLVRALLDAHATARAPITRPTYDGRAGWPVIVDADVLAEVRNSSAESGALQAIFERHERETAMVKMSEEIVVLEIRDSGSAAHLRKLTADH